MYSINDSWLSFTGYFPSSLGYQDTTLDPKFKSQLLPTLLIQLRSSIQDMTIHKINEIWRDVIQTQVDSLVRALQYTQQSPGWTILCNSIGLLILTKVRSSTFTQSEEKMAIVDHRSTQQAIGKDSCSLSIQVINMHAWRLDPLSWRPHSTLLGLHFALGSWWKTYFVMEQHLFN